MHVEVCMEVPRGAGWGGAPGAELLWGWLQAVSVHSEVATIVGLTCMNFITSLKSWKQTLSWPVARGPSSLASVVCSLITGANTKGALGEPSGTSLSCRRTGERSVVLRLSVSGVTQRW